MAEKDNGAMKVDVDLVRQLAELLDTAQGGGTKGTRLLLRVLTGERVIFGIFVGTKKRNNGSKEGLKIIYIRKYITGLIRILSPGALERSAGVHG